MLKINCDMCDKELTEPGALLLSPPSHFVKSSTLKSHLCVDCWEDIDDFIFQRYAMLKGHK